jgi:ABC-type multidrug transport system fused ATPase/permease subunit
MTPLYTKIFFGNKLIDRRIAKFLTWSLISGLLVYALEMVGFVMLGDLIGGGVKSEVLASYIAWIGLKNGYLIILIFSLKLFLGLLFSWISLGLMKGLLLLLTNEVASKHLAFGVESAGSEGDLPSMTRDCLTLITYLDGNYFRQLSSIIQEGILLAIVAAYLMTSYGIYFLFVTIGLTIFFVAIKFLTSRMLVRLGERVLEANSKIVRAINELYRLRKELNVWRAVQPAVQKIENNMDLMMTPYYQSELVLVQLRPVLELAAVTALVALTVSGKFSSADIIIIGMFLLRTLPSVAKLQLGMTALSASKSAKNTIQRVLQWS